MRHVTMVLFAACLAACVPDTGPNNTGEDAGPTYDDATRAGCEFDVLDKSCCDDPDYEARHMDMCLERDYIKHKSTVRDKASDLNDRRVAPSPDDALRNCERPAGELVHLCSEVATAQGSCYWGAYPAHPDYSSGSRYEVQCECANNDDGFDRLRRHANCFQ